MTATTKNEAEEMMLACWGCGHHYSVPVEERYSRPCPVCEKPPLNEVPHEVRLEQNMMRPLVGARIREAYIGYDGERGWPTLVIDTEKGRTYIVEVASADKSVPGTLDGLPMGGTRRDRSGVKAHLKVGREVL